MTEAVEVLVADVLLHGVRAGWIECFPEEVAYRFEFDPAWLADPDRATLGQLFEDRLPRPIETHGLPLWFKGLLPQGLIRRAIARASGLEQHDEFALLLALGADLPGAVAIRPAAPRHVVPRPISRPPGNPTAALHLSAALAGAQWKLSVREGERGLVVPVSDATGNFIAKFHDAKYPDLPRVEHATTCWARAAGIRTPEVRLGRIEELGWLPEGTPTGDGSVFFSRRYDRNPTVHQEDFAQILDRPDQFNGHHEEIARVLSALSPVDVGEYLERLVFCILAGNGDAHLKNWAVTYPDRIHPRLSPAYDLIPTILYRPADDLALALGNRKAFQDLDLTAFEPMGRLLGPQLVEHHVRTMAHRVRTAWTAGREDFGFTPQAIERIEAHLARVPL